MKNPNYKKAMARRKSAQRMNRDAHGLMPRVKVPKQPNKYVPHYGAKEAAKYAARARDGRGL